MNDRSRAIQLSLAVHAVAILLLIVAGNRLVSENKLLVVDFTLSDTVETSGSHGGSMVMVKKREFKGRETESRIQEQQAAVPEPEKMHPAEQEVLPATPVVQQVSPAHAEAPGLTYSGKTVAVENRGSQDTGSMFSLRENDSAIPSGGGTKGTSAGNSEDAQGGGRMGYLKANFSYIRDMITRKIIYPETAREMGWQGKVKVSFVISSDGFVKDIQILQSSGIEILDKNAVETVKNASPFPRPPVAAQLIIPISYKLH
jgi:periplasmic protein TonB